MVVSQGSYKQKDEMSVGSPRRRISFTRFTQIVSNTAYEGLVKVGTNLSSLMAEAVSRRVASNTLLASWCDVVLFFRRCLVVDLACRLDAAGFRSMKFAGNPFMRSARDRWAHGTGRTTLNVNRHLMERQRL